MQIVLTRVDERLIHGQVVLGWTRAVGATRIVVANDEVAGNGMQQTLMKLAVPAGVKVSFLAVEDAGEQLAAQAFGHDRILVLVKDPQSLLGLMKAGLKLEKVNIGHIRAGEGKHRLSKEVHVSPEDLLAWKKLDLAGVKLEAQWLPDQTPTNLNSILREKT